MTSSLPWKAAMAPGGEGPHGDVLGDAAEGDHGVGAQGAGAVRDVAGGRPDHGDASAGEEGGEVREQGVIREARAKGRRRCLAHVV
jgi:hypothetical protein